MSEIYFAGMVFVSAVIGWGIGSLIYNLGYRAGFKADKSKFKDQWAEECAKEYERKSVELASKAWQNHSKKAVEILLTRPPK